MSAQLALAFRRRDAGESSSSVALPGRVVEALENALLGFRGRPAVTSDMVHGELSQSVRDALATHPNAIGALFTQLARRGILERTGATVRSQRVGARGRRIAVWRFR